MRTQPILPFDIRPITFASIVLSSLAASTLIAQPLTDSFTYQGQLIDEGVPATGLYDVTFRVFDAASGGVVVGNVSQTVEAIDGLFEAFLDFGTMGAVFDSDETRWLELRMREVGQPGFTTLLPRQRLTPAPVANYALGAGYAETSNTSLQDAYEISEIITIDPSIGFLNIQSTPSFDGGIGLINSVGELGAVLFNDNLNNTGSLELWGAGGQVVNALRPDLSSGGGGSLFIARNSEGGAGVVIEGNYFGSQAPRLTMVSEVSTMRFDTFTTGDLSVVVPNDSINSLEIRNEVGAAELGVNGVVNLTPQGSVIDTLASVSIDCPTAGLVLVLSTMELVIPHLTGVSSSVVIAVSSSATVIPSSGDIETRIPGGNPTGTYDHATTVHAIFPVSQGLNTFYLLGDQNSTGTAVAVFDYQLSAVFIPTAYGAVSLNDQAAANVHDDLLSPQAPMTNQDILVEQNKAIIANAQRLEREVETMKAQMQQLIESAERAGD